MNNPQSINRSWYLFDLNEKILGRASSEIAIILQGKNLVKFNRSTDCGNFVVVINAEKFKLTGSKMEQKYYYKHSGYIGNLKQESIKDKLASNPCEIVEHSIRGMLAKNKLRGSMLKRLKIYSGPEHPHQNIKFVN